MCLLEKGCLSAPPHVPLPSLLRAGTQQQARGGLRHSTCFAMFVPLRGWDPSPAAAPCVTQHPPTCCPICHCPWACWSSSSTMAELCPATHVPQQHCACRQLHNRPLGTCGTAPHPAQLPAPQCWSPNAVSLLPLGAGGDPSSTPEPAPWYLELPHPLH